MYENFLSTVPLLSGLNTWEKAKIADALETETFEKGEIVIHQGDVGEYFYLVESGEAEVIIDGRGVVKNLASGDYFGGSNHPILLALIFIGYIMEDLTFGRTSIVERCTTCGDCPLRFIP